MTNDARIGIPFHFLLVIDIKKQIGHSPGIDPGTDTKFDGFYHGIDA
jgi:hypothetical protein